MISSSTPSTTADYKVDSKPDYKFDTASLIREQERLRLESLRHLEQLRIRRDQYQICRVSQHRVPNQSHVNREVCSANASSSELVFGSGEKKTLIYGDNLCYRPVSTTVKSSSSQWFSALNNSNVSIAPRFVQPLVDGQRHSTSATLSDDVRNEKWSASATQAARKKLLSGRSEAHLNVNNSSSVDAYSGSRLLESGSISSTFADSNGNSKALGLETDSAGYFFSEDSDTDKVNNCVTPQKTELSLEGTPKSILRHRQIIDQNVHVESKFNHTPTANVHSRKHRRGLNFSYSDVDDAQLFGRKTKSVNFNVDSKKVTSKSNSQAADLNSQVSTSEEETKVKTSAALSSSDITLPSSQRFYYAPNATDSSENSADARTGSTTVKVASDRLLLQTGNDRRNAKIVRELENRPQSGLFSSDQPLDASTSGSQVLKNSICSSILNHLYKRYAILLH